MSGMQWSSLPEDVSAGYSASGTGHYLLPCLSLGSLDLTASDVSFWALRNLLPVGILLGSALYKLKA
jgi:hypothetical protein